MNPVFFIYLVLHRVLDKKDKKDKKGNNYNVKGFYQIQNKHF